jgi:hypothetical protein
VLRTREYGYDASVIDSMEKLVAHLVDAYPGITPKPVGYLAEGHLVRIKDIFLLAAPEFFGVQVGIGNELLGPYWYKFAFDVDVGLQIFSDAVRITS